MTDDTETIALDEIERLAFAALCRAGTDPANARPVAASVAAAEAQGLASHGLLRLPTYCDHVACGKVDGRARPVLSQPRPGVAVVDAATGFAHPAIDLGLPVVAEAARRNGIALLGITNSYYCGVVGDHVERLAREGLVALGFVNAPASIAPWGGITPLFGTNPIAFAFPVAGADPIVIDQSSSVVARGEIMLRAKMGANLPEGWALDADGRPTIDAAAALRGRLMPAGGHKGAGQALMVEILAAALIGAQFGFEASSVATMEGGAAAYRPKLHRDRSGLSRQRLRIPGRGADRRDAAATGRAGARGTPTAARSAARSSGVRIARATLDDLRRRADA